MTKVSKIDIVPHVDTGQSAVCLKFMCVSLTNIIFQCKLQSNLELETSPKHRIVELEKANKEEREKVQELKLALEEGSQDFLTGWILFEQSEKVISVGIYDFG